MDNMNIENTDAEEAVVSASVDETAENKESGVTLIPFEEENVDFDTFCKSDFRVVKVKDCVQFQKVRSY